MGLWCFVHTNTRQYEIPETFVLPRFCLIIHLNLFDLKLVDLNVYIALYNTIANVYTYHYLFI